MLVMKFGGTSVGSAERMCAVAGLLPKSGRIMVVLSAMSGTTNDLLRYADFLRSEDFKNASELCHRLAEKYKSEVKKLITDEAARSELQACLDECFRFLSALHMEPLTPFAEKEIVALGEIMSSTMFHHYLKTQGLGSVLMHAPDFMRIDCDGEPDLSLTQQLLSERMAQHPETRIFITQGFICRNEFGRMDNLKRGGSDYTASIIGGILKAEEIQIWTDIDGMHNNDPRIVSGTRPVHKLSFDEAAELAYFGAKILHPQTILPARAGNVPVRLLNTMQPEARGTIISQQSEGGGIKAIAAKDGISAIHIKSDRMLLAYGFLRRVFEVFESYRTPIDMIATSEVAVSLTIDNPENLERIVQELKKFGTISTDTDLTIICIVGGLVAESKGVAAMIFNALTDIPVRMISYGGSPNNISLLVKTAHKGEALRALHQKLFA